MTKIKDNGLFCTDSHNMDNKPCPIDRIKTSSLSGFINKNKSLISKGIKDSSAFDKYGAKIVGRIELGGRINKILIRDNKAYVSYSFRDLAIIELEDIYNPSLISSNRPGGNLMDFSLMEEFVLISCLPAGVKLLNVSDQKKPYFRKWILSDVLMPVIDVKNNYLFGCSNGLFKIFDISSIEKPLCAGTLKLGYKRIKQLLLCDDIVFILADKILVISLKDISSPELISEYKARNIISICIKKDILYSLDSGGIFYSTDIKNAAKPVELSNYHSDSRARGLFVFNGNAFISTRKNTDIIDISNPLKPFFKLNLIGHLAYARRPYIYIANYKKLLILDAESLLS